MRRQLIGFVCPLIGSQSVFKLFEALNGVTRLSGENIGTTTPSEKNCVKVGIENMSKIM